MRRRRWPRGVPVLLLAGLCAALAWEVRRQLDETHVPAVAEANVELPEQGRGAEPAPAAPPDYRPPPAGAFDEVVARNLFSTKRRPPPLDDAGADGDAGAGVLELVLSGVVIANDHRVAILKDAAGQQVIRLAPGETYEGWRLVALDARRAVFRRGEREATLDLAFAPEAPRPGARDPRRAAERARDSSRQAGDEAGAASQRRRGDGQGESGQGLRQQSIQERLQGGRD